MVKRWNIALQFNATMCVHLEEKKTDCVKVDTISLKLCNKYFCKLFNIIKILDIYRQFYMTFDILFFGRQPTSHNPFKYMHFSTHFALKSN